MFQPSEPFKLSPRALAASFLFHTSAITLLCLMAGSPAPTPVRRKLRAILIAPVPERRVLRVDTLPRPRRNFIAPPLQAPEAPPKPIAHVLDPPPLRAPDPPPVPLLQAEPALPAAPAAAPRSEVKLAGFGTAEVRTGPAHRGKLVHTAGFGDAQTTTAAAVPTTASLAPADFGDTTVTAPAAHLRTTASSPTIPVEILDKPRPAYTDEARRLKIQGEVLLEVAFAASGELRVLRVIRGLGHGLDETAAAAARQIRFRPALNNGAPVDSTAVVHIVFQLAY